MTEYDTALISLDDSPAVMGEFPLDYRWNGWLCPRIDALGVVTTLAWLNSDPAYYDIYGYDYEWREDGALILTDRQYADEMGEDYEPEVLMPNEDGLYDLGSHSWVWSYHDWNDDPYHRGE